MKNRSLTDRFNRQVTYLRLSVTDRCNFRCTYCMPSEKMRFMPSSELLSFEEIETVVTAMASCGVRRVRITGGEPLVRREIPSLVRMLKDIDGIDEVAMTSNGHLLTRDADALAQAGLDSLNVSLDSLDEKRFSAITRGGSLETVLAGIEAARAAGMAVKINTVAIKNFNDDEVVSLVRFAVERGLELRFIEFMPIGADTIWEGGRCLPAKEIRSALAEHWELRPEGFRAGKGPASYWALHEADAGGEPVGRVGIIAAVTECFCDGCNRIRMTAQGGLRACLASDKEVNLRDIMRAGGDAQEVLRAVRWALTGKDETHAFDLEGEQVTIKQMVSIGG